MKTGYNLVKADTILWLDNCWGTESAGCDGRYWLKEYDRDENGELDRTQPRGIGFVAMSELAPILFKEWPQMPPPGVCYCGHYHIDSNGRFDPSWCGVDVGEGIDDVCICNEYREETLQR